VNGGIPNRGRHSGARRSFLSLRQELSRRTQDVTLHKVCNRILSFQIPQPTERPEELAEPKERRQHRNPLHDARGVFGFIILNAVAGLHYIASVLMVLIVLHEVFLLPPTRLCTCIADTEKGLEETRGQ
jgi:hypothetical protein